MYFWDRIKNFFKPKEHDLAARLLLLKLHQDTHTYAIGDLLDSGRKCDDFKHLVAGAVSNMDTRIKDLEDKMDFLFKHASAQEDKLDSLEQRINNEDLDKLVQTATVKSPQN